VLGLVFGFAFWTNFLSVVFALPAAILVLRSGLGPVVRGLPAAVAAFALGSLPHWLYGLPHGTALPRAGGWIGWGDVALHLEAVGGIAWPILAGVPTSVRESPPGVALALALAAAFALAVGFAVRAVWRPPGGRRAAALAVVALIAVNVSLAVGTHHGDRIDNDPKYFLPVYTALPALAGAGLAALPGLTWAPILGGILAVQVAGAVEGQLQALRADGQARLAADREARAATLAAIERSGLDRLYTQAPDPTILMYLSNERIVVSDPYQEGYPPSAHAVDGARRVGWWFGGRDALFETSLAALGVHWAFLPLGPWGGAYADFALPAVRLRELDPATLRVTALPNPDAAARTLDRNILTGWTTDGPKQGGEWLQVDLGEVHPVALIRWLPRVFQEIPSGVTLDASVDGVSWQRLLELPDYYGPFYWSAGRPMLRVRSGRVELRIPPTPARHLRITQTGADTRWSWSVAELFVYAADPSGPTSVPDGDGSPLARAVRAAGIRRLYADHGWSYRLALADPELRVPPANLPLDAYNAQAPDWDLFPLVRWEPGSGALLDPPDVPGFLRAAEAAGIAVEHTEAGGLSLFTYRPPTPTPGRPVPPAALRITASAAGDRAAGLADRRTTWSTGRGRLPGDWLRVDLATSQRVRAVRVSTQAIGQMPRALHLEATTDGAHWAPVPARVQSEERLRWAGVTWLREHATAVRLEIEPTAVRGLRLVLGPGEPDLPWSAEDLIVYAE
jgi:F5/8 type C domain-containing protein